MSGLRQCCALAAMLFNLHTNDLCTTLSFSFVYTNYIYCTFRVLLVVCIFFWCYPSCRFGSSVSDPSQWLKQLLQGDLYQVEEIISTELIEESVFR